MPDDLTPDAVARQTFTQARRGYDRGEVERFLAEVAAHMRDLESRVSGVAASMEQLGISELPDVRREIASVSAEVGEILEEARKAAEQMRTRAAADAARWRAEADTTVRKDRTAAQKDSEKARKDAWEASTEMLTQAQERAAELTSEAEKDALFIRAEAEREALRMTGDARRDAEEVVREARTDAERVLMAARAEAENIQSDARQSAEAAQQRARALEQRRTELMSELESARQSIGQLESEIDSRRESLHQAATSSSTTMRVIDSEQQAASAAEAWVDDDASVKIVPASRVRTDEPVDADALVAEVEQLRARASEIVIEEIPEETTAAEAGDEPAPVESMVPDAAVAESDAAGPPADDAEEPAGEETEEEAPSGEEVEEDHVIDDLFASLRAAPVEEPTAEPQPEPATAADDDEPAEEVASREAPVAAPALSLEAATDADPFDVRDRFLLPISNRSLRSIKREIVELQNRVLEELRTSGSEWNPEAAMFSAALAEDVGRLIQESFVAGHAAAAELVGSATTPQPSDPPASGGPADFVEGLTSAVASALAEVRGANGGARQVSAAVSKVFRAWRTDEAERRLRFLSRSAYHDGVLGGLAQLGVEMVMAVASGRPCGECAATGGMGWAPTEEPGDGSAIPPALLGCDDTVVPAETSS